MNLDPRNIQFPWLGQNSGRGPGDLEGTSESSLHNKINDLLDSQTLSELNLRTIVSDQLYPRAQDLLRSSAEEFNRCLDEHADEIQPSTPETYWHLAVAAGKVAILMKLVDARPREFPDNQDSIE